MFRRGKQWNSRIVDEKMTLSELPRFRKNDALGAKALQRRGSPAEGAASRPRHPNTTNLSTPRVAKAVDACLTASA
jgi:hypothetical protein